MRGTIVLDRRVEYSILHEVRPIGPSIGFYAGRDIRESVVDVFGRRFLYAGIAPRKWDGVFDVEALEAGEFCSRRTWIGSVDAHRSSRDLHLLARA